MSSHSLLIFLNFPCHYPGKKYLVNASPHQRYTTLPVCVSFHAGCWWVFWYLKIFSVYMDALLYVYYVCHMFAVGQWSHVNWIYRLLWGLNLGIRKKRKNSKCYPQVDICACVVLGSRPMQIITSSKLHIPLISILFILWDISHFIRNLAVLTKVAHRRELVCSFHNIGS